ncbi:MAG: ParB/RepB/Spo0J family partition protein [Planctomycetota bacterium]
MPTSKLGTSLESLLAKHKPAKKTPTPPQPPATSDEILHIPVADIKPNPSQPRLDFQEDAFQELVQSVRQNGIIQPVIVRRSGDAFELIAGERRWRAAKAAGLSAVPAQVRNVDSAKAFELSVIENIQRQDLNAIEKATAYKRLIETFELTQELAAQRLGINRSTMANVMRLLELPSEIQDAVSRGTISMGHARALLSLRTAEEQLTVWRKTEKNDLSVRQVEKLAAKGGVSSRRPRRRPDDNKEPHIRDLEEQLRGALGTKVSIVATKPNAGRVIVEYYSLDDFDRIVERVLDRPNVTSL